MLSNCPLVFFKEQFACHSPLQRRFSRTPEKYISRASTLLSLVNSWA
jgi:hypothetical protein